MPTLYRILIRLAVVGLVLGALASCATQPRPESPDAPGFLLGFWHGLIMVPTFIASLFTDCRIYAFPNSGGWYDFGFVLGAGSAFGSSGAAARGTNSE